MLLAIDTSRDSCSVAITDGQHVDERSSLEPRSHASLVAPFVSDLLGQLSGQRPDGIVVVAGPGSYTGLRIGLASAKGLCMALDAQLYAVSTLEVMAFAAWNGDPISEHPADSSVVVVPRFRARQSEWYMGAYELKPATDGVKSRPTRRCPDAVVKDADVRAWLSRHVGTDATVETEICSSAAWAARLVQEAPGSYLLEEPSTFEPYYLKSVDARPREGSIFDRLPFGGS